MNSMGTNRKILWPNQLYWLWFVWKSFIENGELKIICVTWGINHDMTLTCLRSNIFLFFLSARCQVVYFQQISKDKFWGWRGWGGWEFKGVNVDNKHIKHHQEYTIIDEVSFACNVGYKFSNKCQMTSFIPPKNDKKQAHR